MSDEDRIMEVLDRLEGRATSNELASIFAPINSLGSHHEQRIWLIKIERALNGSSKVAKEGSYWVKKEQ